MTQGPFMARGVRRPFRAAVGARWRYLSGASLYVRMVLAVTLALCLALLIGTLNEARVAAGLQQQANQAASTNAHLRQDIAATARQVSAAESDATIEREAHRLGYFLPGEPWVVTIPSTSPVP